ncbi:MAG: septum formation initiator family protein [Candidatus Competibacteraceae bacterium]|nr:septum formation initiator family protein [Candidatus Competibacteraceae bacterium]
MAYPTEHRLSLQILAAVLIAVLVFLHYLLWVDEVGMRQTRALRIAIQVQKDDNAALSERNKGLDAEVKDLKSGLMAIEERARAEMGMIRPDEIFYRLLEQPLPQPVTPLIPHKAVPPGKSATPARKPPGAVKPLAPTAKPSLAPPKPTTKPSAPPAKPKPAPTIEAAEMPERRE